MADASLVNSRLHCNLCTRAVDPDSDTHAFQTERFLKTPPHPQRKTNGLGPTFHLGSWQCHPPRRMAKNVINDERRAANQWGKGGSSADDWLTNRKNDEPHLELHSRDAKQKRRRTVSTGSRQMCDWV